MQCEENEVCKDHARWLGRFDPKSISEEVRERLPPLESYMA